ncbi:MAG: FecR domain-containing protein [Bacteroidota bacterium]
MTLDDFRKLLTRYLYRGASTDDKRRIDNWLQKIENESLQSDDSKSQHHRERIYEVVKQQISTPAQRRISFSWRIAAAVALLLTVGVYQLRFSILDAIDPIALKEVSTSRFEVRRVTLPDSSVVIVNVGSSIQYPEFFRGKKRNVRLHGQAFFDITKDPSHPFHIESGELNVQVFGTSFVVTDFGKDSVVEVTVKTGLVAVTSHDQELGVLSPLQQISYDQSINGFALRKNVGPDIRWTTNQFSFREVMLRDVFEAISHRYNVIISTNDPKILSRKFTGSFDQVDNADKILQIISLSYGWTIQNDGTQYTIRKTEE